MSYNGGEAVEMKSRFFKVLILIISVATLGVGAFFAGEVKGSVEELASMEKARELASIKKEKAKEKKEIEVPWVSLDEIFVNVGSKDNERTHSLAVRVELELFEEFGRDIVDRYQSGIRHAIIQAALEQKYVNLNTVEGKLYFKEILVGRINEFVKMAVIRDVHFGSFYLQ